MATQEDRLTRLEDIATEHRSALLGIAYDLTRIRSSITDQTHVTQGLRRDLTEAKERLSSIEHQLSNMGEQLGQILMLLRPTQQ